MNPNTIVAAMVAERGDKVVVDKSWRNDWSNFTDDELRQFENACEMKFNSNQDVQNCINQMKAKQLAGGGGSTAQGGNGINWGNTLQNSLDLFNKWRDNKNSGGTNNNVYVAPASTGMSTGAKVGIAIGVIALIGGLVWYFKFRNK